MYHCLAVDSIFLQKHAPMIISMSNCLNDKDWYFQKKSFKIWQPGCFNRIYLLECVCRLALHAPESIEVDEKGNLYAGLHDGRIVKVLPCSVKGIGMGNIENITNGILEKAATVDGSERGRPLGE